MIYHDRVYGKIKITEPVILDLIKSKAIQRLKDIEQGGYTPLYNNIRKLPFSQIAHKRFEHSVGVFILLRKFGASLEEQIAGLIHDISHSVFSHATDFVFRRSETQSHQDEVFNKFFRKSDVPFILKKYGYQPEKFLNNKNFQLLEKDLPGLCADRIDYILKLALVFKEASRQETDYFLRNLSIDKNKWIFKNYQSAKKFAKLFFRINKIYLANIKAAVMFIIVGDLLKYALKKKYITIKDIYSTDKNVLRKIKKYLNDKKLSNLLKRMNGKIKFKNDPKDYEFHIFLKSRVVDPLFRAGDKLKRLSGVDRKWKKIVQQDLKPKEYFIKFL